MAFYTRKCKQVYTISSMTKSGFSYKITRRTELLKNACLRQSGLRGGTRSVMKKNYPKIDLCKTGQNIKHIMLLKGLTVRDVREYLELAAPQSVYHWLDGD